MAADSEEPTRRGKRKRDQTRPKLISGERVEVRSLEEGFLGSWHSGKVVRCEKSWRHVEYDHILCDDESAPLVEFVSVGPVIDGVKSAQWEPNNNNNRGVIRPLPPSLGFTKLSLGYGQCVDSFIDDAWWEGLIFDHEDGSEERKIFFPDQGDDMTVRVDNLRITQEWDELTEKWKPRGNWIFLEIIDEVKQESPLFVSVKQIWYEVREKIGKNNLKEWTFAVKDYWRELVSQVIFDNLKMTVDQFLGLLNSSERFVQEGPLLEFSESILKAVMKPETHINNSLPLVPFTESPSKVEKGGVLHNNLNVSHHHIIENEVVPEGLVPSIGEIKVEVGFSTKNVDPSHDKTEPLPLPELPFSSHSAIGASGSLLDVYGETIPCTNSEASSVKLKSSRKRKNGVEWLPLALEGEPYPDAIIQFKRRFMHNCQNPGLHSRVRKHLLHLGWKIECVKVKSNMTRFRYFSPSGHLYTSLLKAVNEIEASSESLPVIPTTRSRDGSPDRSLELPGSEIIIDPECCPQAVSDYVLTKESAVPTEKGKARLGDGAKKHLIFSGWKVFNYWGRGSKQFRYMSPNGKNFYSLLAACKWYVEESASCPDTDHAEKRQSGNICVKTESQILSKLRTKRKLSFHESRGLLDVTDTKSPPRVLRSSKRARQVALSSSHRTPRTILSWLIDNNVVLPETTVRYCGRKDGGSPLKEGKITRDGIKCNCCQKVYSLSNFETHAGSTNRRPSANIILEDGRSLHECQLEMKHKSSMKNSDSEPRVVQESRALNRNDHICSICHDGGDLILCDRCPSSFHTSCLGMKVIPEGDWFCPSCRCGICDESGFNKSNDQFTDNNILCCYQCGHQYHFGCIRDKSSLETDNYPKGNWFCNRRCEQIFLGLRQLLGKPIPVGTDKLTWTLLKYINPNDSYGAPDDEYMTENYGKLSIALSVMHECFEPVKESRTRRDLMEDVIFSRGSELNRLNFQGFYTVVLEKNDELITVATIRVHDEKVAEIPLVATRFQYRRHGMCRVLMNELEKQLGKLGVERLVLPAVSSALDTWTLSFGFKEMKDSERLNFLKYTFLDFQGTIMCQKLLTNITPMDSSVSPETNQQSPDHIDNGNTDLDGNIAISEVFQAEHLNGSDTVDQASLDPTGGESGGSNNDTAPPPVVRVVKSTLHCCSTNATLDDYSAAEQKEDEKFKCYQRRRLFQPVEAKLV